MQMKFYGRAENMLHGVVPTIAVAYEINHVMVIVSPTPVNRVDTNKGVTPSLLRFDNDHQHAD